MLARKGDKAVVKVLDFGLARATRESPIDGGLTHEGQMLGTPDFIAPEQIRDAQSAGIQADIYSLGCTLYYLLTGAPPFEGPSLYDLLQAHFSMTAQPLNLVRPEVPVELAALVAKMMAKDPNRRFQTPAEVAEALKPFFKKAAATAKPEVSTLGEPGSRVEKNQAVPATAEMVTSTPQQPTKSADSPSFSSGSQSQILAAVAGPSGSGDALQAAPALGSGSRPPWKSLPLIIASGAFGLMLGVIIILITKNGRVTIDTEKGNTTITIDETAPGRGKLSARASETGDSPGGKPSVRPNTSPSGTEIVSSASGSESPPSAPAAGSQGERATTLAGDRRPDAAAGPPPSGIKPPVTINSIGMKLALLPAGEFLMGSPDPNAPPNERPEHKVRISTPFYLGVTEVTQAQYEAVTGNNPSYFSPKGEGRDKVAGQPNGEYPVEQVSWFDAVLFCNGLSKKEGFAPYYRVNEEEVIVPDTKGSGYRLPTEAEWEYACRGGKSGPYSPGPEPLVEYGWFRANSNGSTHPVGKKRRNEFGLFDMAANVWEWCFDEYSAEYYQRSPVDDPPGPTGMSTRVRRGGSGWRSPQRASWWSNRGGVVPTDRSLVCGFRVARTQAERQDRDQPRVPDAAADVGGAAETLTKDPTIQPPSTTIVSMPMTKSAQAAAGQTPAPPLVRGSPEELLQARGLTRSGAYFVVASENEVLERAKKIRPLIDQMARAFEQYALVLQNEMQLAEAEEFRVLRSNQIDSSNAALSNMPNGSKANSFQNEQYQVARAFRDGLERERAAAARTAELLRSRQVPKERKDELAKDFAAKRSDFLKAAGELKPIHDKAMSEYRKLQADRTVKEALDAFRRSTKAAAFLGPSRDFQRAIDTITEAERAYAPEIAAPKKKGRPPKR
ncbi:MAG TPA: SUMF1/EgtB/PvdO family nonheme iron enzyme [Isosphaeraceae bacterium]|nr:SUMF1/EgtB/PvdO family nonheme iron enzyme [Isosphaeraceae bacterium]